jgi:hypothetical protein
MNTYKISPNPSFAKRGIKGIKPQGKPWTRILNGMTPPQADGVMNLPAASCRVSKGGNENPPPFLKVDRGGFLNAIWYYKDETFEKCSISFKFKEGENFNRRNTLGILRIKI